MTTVVAHSRLHFALLDLGRATQRIYGGVGAALEEPTTQVSVARSASLAISGDGMGEDLLRDLWLALERLSRFADCSSAVSVRLEAFPPMHVGLGSKTTAVLAVLAAVNIELALGLKDRELQVLSGRGGTSGIGVHSFFRGGLVLDAGHRATEPRTFRPSSAGSGGEVPPLVTALPMPTDWNVALLLVEGKRWSAAEEEGFFASNTPIENVEVDRSVTIACLDLASSVAEANLAGFASAIRALQTVGFKRREVESQPQAIRSLIDTLQAIPSVAAGMSSVGPLVYAVYDSADQRSRAQVELAGRAADAALIATTRFANRGYQHK